MVTYVVKEGDTLAAIAKMFGVSVEQIVEDNNIDGSAYLVPGSTLVILTDKIVHTVSRGDTLYNIARRYGVSFESVLNANPDLVNATLYPGMEVIVPVDTQKWGSIEVNGYAFPNITNETLSRTLPSLTYLSIFSYSVTESGNLLSIDDTRLIDMAKAYGVKSVMVITNNSEYGGGFSGEITNALFSSSASIETLITNVINTLNEKGYYAVNVDFEYIYPEDQERYNEFLELFKSRLEPLGYKLFTAIAPKTSRDQQGLLYQAHDYAAHGRIVDRVIIMTYEWGYTYGPPLAVSPINEVERVIKYAVTEIPSDKILLGVPNYGYDWNLPYKEGTAARTISNVGAVDLAREVGSNISFDTKSMAPYFYYMTNENEHIVWFEDARSVEAKLKVVKDYNLAGISIWTINRFFPQLYLVLNALFDVVKL